MLRLHLSKKVHQTSRYIMGHIPMFPDLRKTSYQSRYSWTDTKEYQEVRFFILAATEIRSVTVYWCELTSVKSLQMDNINLIRVYIPCANKQNGESRFTLCKQTEWWIQIYLWFFLEKVVKFKVIDS